MTNTLSNLLIDFLKYLKTNQKCSTKTLQNYNFYLNRFVNWYSPNKKISGINLKTIKQYCSWLNRLSDVHGIPLKINTQNYHLIALRSLLKHLNGKDIKTISPSSILLTKTIPTKIVNLGDGELSRLLEAPLSGGKKDTKRHLPATLSLARRAGGHKGSVTKIQFRDKAILEVLYSTGLRVSELVKLRKISKLKLSAQARYWLDEYLKNRDDKNPHLFISYDPSKDTKKTTFAPPSHIASDGRSKATAGKQENTKLYNFQPLTVRSIQRIVQKYAKLAGIKEAITPHTLRHSHRISQSETD